MNILGISALDKESTATVVCDGVIVAAVSEERLTRVKQQAGFPTVLANAFRPSVTEALHQRLQRNDFMPFAPATLERAAAACYNASEKVAHAARFMTVCLSCTQTMKESSPAAVHVDGTARPQFVSKESNADLFAILEEVEKRTGAPSGINSSFNIHEEPIVCSPADAIRAFRDGRLDYLALESFLVEPA